MNVQTLHLHTFFAPQLIITDCAGAIEFYKKAFGIVELQRWSDPDGTVHVAELSFDGAIFHIHEPTASYPADALKAATVTVIIGVFVEDVYGVVSRAIAAGAKLIDAVKDHEYRYRQGTVEDPFGHHWLIEKKI
jgi:PhnB protein